jgi:glycosyltransferase involved in cell wall biosynthesis
MRVLHVTRDFPPQHRGGISTVVGGLVHASLRAGISPAVISFDDWRPRASAGASARRPRATSDAGMPLFRVTSSADVDAARAFAASFRPAVLHAHHGMLWEFTATLRATLSVPVVKTIHVVQRELARHRGSSERTLSAAGQDAALAAADRIVVPSHAAARALLADAPGLHDRVRAVSHGIDDSPAARAAAADDAARALGPVSYAGRFADVKGTADFLAAVPHVLERMPDTSFVIAGGIPGNTKAEGRWRRQWAGRAASARVRLAGWLSPPELGRLYAAASVLAVPSHVETFGLVALEGMLHGAPIVAADIPALRELIADGQTGLLYRRGDPLALADAIVALLGDAGRARRLGREAAAMARRERLWEHALPALRRVYEEVCRAR